MLGKIILRDVPKQEVRIDLYKHDIQGGFRGLQQVPPGLHYVSVLLGESHTGFWTWVQPSQIVVRRLEGTQFVKDDPETEAEYQQLAGSGAMNHVLMTYDHRLFGHWFSLTNHLQADDFPPTLLVEDSGAGSRFEQAFMGSHAGNVDSFLAEFQFAFLSWLISQDHFTQDEAAFARWRHLLLAIYNAGERSMRNHPTLFTELIDTLIAQFKLLPAEWFEAGTFLTAQLNYLIEDMIDTDIESVVQAAQQLNTYLETR